MKIIKGWCLRHINAIILSFCSILLLGSMLFLGASIVSSTNTAPETDVAALKDSLKTEALTVESALETKHKELLDQLGTVNEDRVTKDTTTIRPLILSLSATSASTLTDDQLRADFITRYPYLGVESQVLAELLSSWRKNVMTQGPVIYQVRSLDIRIIEIQGSTYSYQGLAQIYPVGEKTENTQYFFITFTTDEKSAVKTIQVQQTSDPQRKASS